MLNITNNLRCIVSSICRTRSHIVSYFITSDSNFGHYLGTGTILNRSAVFFVNMIPVMWCLTPWRIYIAYNNHLLSGILSDWGWDEAKPHNECPWPDWLHHHRSRWNFKKRWDWRRQWVEIYGRTKQGNPKKNLLPILICPS